MKHITLTDGLEIAKSADDHRATLELFLLIEQGLLGKVVHYFERAINKRDPIEIFFERNPDYRNLKNAFSWVDTDEGPDFWVDVYNDMARYSNDQIRLSPEAFVACFKEEHQEYVKSTLPKVFSTMDNLIKEHEQQTMVH